MQLFFDNYETLLAIFTGLYLLFMLFSVVGHIRLHVRQKKYVALTHFPTVSVLISCKNEEDDLPTCLDSLAALDYPEGKIDFWIVDDRSTDRTAKVIQSFTLKNSNFHYLSTEDYDTHLEAKARGISFAAKHAKGEWLFITDADAQVPSKWIKEMLKQVDDSTGVIGGMLAVNDIGILGKLERNTWGFTLPFAAAMSGWNKVFICVGPNMAIRRKAYENAGGLEAANFKIAEDLAIFQLAKQSGYQANFMATKESTVELKPVPTFWHLFSQLRRWLRGGFEATFEYWIGLSLSLGVCFTMASLLYIGLFTQHPAFIKFFLLKCLGDSLLILSEKLIIGKSRYIRYLPIIWMSNLFIFIWLPLSMLFSPRVHWKGKDYDIKY